ncbi:MAG: PAS domain S-box protein, partial [Dehalococcoidales bacterium]
MAKVQELDKSVFLNSITELVAYQDRELRVVWTNQAAADAAGQTPEQLIGKHCYEIWAQRDVPCAGCPLVKVLESNKPESAEIATPDGRYWEISGYPVRDERDNLEGLLEITRDITTQKHAEEAIERRLEFEKLVSHISSQFIENLDIDDAVNKALAAMGRYSGADRAYIFQINKDKAAVDNTHEWCDKGIAPQIDNLKNLSTDSVSWWTEKLEVGDRIHIPDVNAIPDEAAKEREILKSQEIKSLLVLPINIKGELSGFIGFDNTQETGTWQDEDMILLRTASEIIGSALLRARMEEELRESEERHRLVFENTGSATLIIEPDTTISLVNEEFVEISGYRRDEVEGKISWTDLIVEEDLERMLRYHRDRRKNAARAPHKYECRFVDRAGNIKDIFLTVDTIPGTGKSVASFVDITEWKRAEEALRENEQRLREVSENARIWVWEVDTRGRYTYSSPNCEQILGYRPEEILQKHSYDLFYPQERDELKKKAFEFFTAKKPFRHFVNRNKTKSGQPVWLSTSGTPLYNKEGEFIGYRGVDTDITHVKSVEEALREERSLFVGGPTVVFKWAAAEGWPIEYVSPNIYDVLGYTDKELTESKRLYSEIIHPDDLPRVVKENRRAEEDNHSPLISEYRILDREENIKWMHEHTVLIKDENGKVTHHHGYVNDITDRKRAYETLKESEAKYRFLTENMTDVIFTTDLNLNMMYVSPSVERILGFTPEESLKRQLEEQLTPASYKLAVETMQTALEKERTIGIGDDQLFNLELEYYHKDGSTRIMEVTCKPIRNEQSELSGVYGLCRDITERKKAERELKDSEEKLSIMLNSVPESIIMTDLSGNILEANEATVRIHGF